VVAVNKLTLGLSATSIALIGLFFGLWRYNAAKRETAENTVKERDATISTLKKEVENQVAFVKAKDYENKKIQAEYESRLASIPRDECGDAKPSTELLNYLRGN